MDYEKKYKETLKRARKIHNDTKFDYEKGMMEEVFPELKECEDERIRRVIRGWIYTRPDSFFDNGISKESMLAWLEKQHTDPYNGVCFDCYGHRWGMCARDNGIEIVMDRIPVRQFSYKDCEQTFGGKSALEAINEEKVTTKETVVPFDYENATIQQKDFAPNEDKPRYSIGDVLCDKSCTTLNKETQPNFEITDIRKGMYICDRCSFPISQQDEYELVAKKIEQKPIDKVELKFHEGDWVVDNCGYVWKIEGILNQFYILEAVEGCKSRPTTEWVDNTFHLWTIKDAKDGDVLKEDSCIFILKKMKSENTAITYCCLFDDGDFNLGPTLSFDVDSTYPATKEQRDTLMKAITDAGYTFDFNKKELKKIEQKSADKVEPKFKVGDVMRTLQEATDGYTDGMPVVIYIDKGYYHCTNELIAIKDQDDYEYPPMNRATAWSEEDMSKVQRICKYLNEAKKYSADITEVRQCMDWLKSLEDRFQPKIEWSEEDDRNLIKVISIVLNASSYDNQLDGYIDWLKSIRPQM